MTLQGSASVPGPGRTLVAGGSGGVTALLLATVFVESMLFGVLPPLLPSLKADLALESASAGVLLSAYAVGSFAAALPGAGLTSRCGAKLTTVLGLGVVAVGMAGFAVAGGYEALVVSRAVQGVGSALCWIGGAAWLMSIVAPTRRGFAFGLLSAAAAGGVVIGPLVGSAAVSVGRVPTLGLLSVVGFLLALLAMRASAVPGDRIAVLRAVRTGWRSARVRSATWLMAVPAAGSGALALLAPLRLDTLGASEQLIAVTFATAGAVGAAVRPAVGIWSDRRGVRPVILALLVTSFVAIAALAWLGAAWAFALVAGAALIAVGVLWAPMMVALADACASAGGPAFVAATLIMLITSPGMSVGALGAGVVAGATSVAIALACLAFVVLAALGLLRRSEI